MVRIEMRYEGDLHCVAVHTPSGRELVTDAPVDNHGRGESFSPTDLVATALVTCMATVMGIVADRHGWNLGGMRLRVDKEMTTGTPRRIARLSAVCEGPAGLDETARRTLEAAAESCPVRHSLLPAIELPLEFRWGASVPEA